MEAKVACSDRRPLRTSARPNAEVSVQTGLQSRYPSASKYWQLDRCTRIDPGLPGAFGHQAGQLTVERDRVLQESQNAQRVADFMVDLFEIPDPGEERGHSITVREILDRGAERIDYGLENQPEVRAGQSSIAERYRVLLEEYFRRLPLSEGK